MAIAPHGTYRRYARKDEHRCRCEECRKAKRAYINAARSRRLTPEDPRHGSRNGYDNFGCRCGPCVSAKSDAWFDYYERLGRTLYRSRRALFHPEEEEEEP